MIVHDVNDSQALPRHAADFLSLALDVSPVVVVTGPHRSGKTTLVRTTPALANDPDRRFLSLDDLPTRAQARTAPQDLVRSAPRLVIDAAHREPELIDAVRRAVDSDLPRQPGRFVLTTSADPRKLPHLGAPLEGRSSFVPLWPLTRRERLDLGTAGTVGLWDDLLAHPVEQWWELVRDSPAHPASWQDLLRPPTDVNDHLRTYLERDVRDLAAVDPMDLYRLMVAASRSLGRLVQQTRLAQAADLTRPTVGRHLDLLEATGQLVRVPALVTRGRRRPLKTPKLYGSDPALALHLAGSGAGGVEPTRAHLENLVLGDLLAWRDGRVPRPKIFTWHTTTGLDVPFVIEHRGELVPVGVTTNRSPRTGDLKSSVAFREEVGDRFRGGLVLHDGEEIEWLSDRVLGVPWWRVV